MIPLIIGVSAALTLVAVAFCVMSSRSDIGRRVAAMDMAGTRRGATESELLRRFVDQTSQGKLREKFAQAGWYKMTVAAYYTRMCLSILGGAVFAALFLFEVGDFSIQYLVGAGVIVLAGYMLPGMSLDRAIKKRKTLIHRSIPDWLDTVSTTVEAGTALNAALAMSLDAIRGPLADELREVLADVRIGRSRAEALTAMAQRVRQEDLSSTVTAMVQTERLGGNIAHVLDELAAEARHRRLMRAEELAAQLPVKMVIPMALFMLPALMVMIFGPVAADIMSRH